MSSPPDTELTLRWWSTARGVQHWHLHFYNGGPGHAKIGSITYRIEFFAETDKSDWLSLGDALIPLKQHGIDTDNDLILSWVGRLRWSHSRRPRTASCCWPQRHGGWPR